MIDSSAAAASRRAARLSVTVLNYNYGRFLPRCLDSILSQSYSDFEVIIIDDRSCDDSLTVIKPFLQDRRVRLIAHPVNRGAISSLIEGAEASCSTYLSVVSADDLVLSTTAFEEQVRAMDSNPGASFCYSSWMYVNSAAQAIRTVVPFASDHVWSGDHEYREFCRRFYVLHSGTIIRRSAYRAAGGYDSEMRYTHDNAMWALLCGEGDVAYLAKPLYGYRVHPTNMSRNPDAMRATIDEFIQLVDRGFANLPDGPVKHDRRLRRRARQAALASVATMLVFAGRPVDGWKAYGYAVRLRPREALLHRRLLSLVARTLLGAQGFQQLQKLLLRNPSQA